MFYGAGDKVKPFSPLPVEPVKKGNRLIAYLNGQQEKEITGSTG